MSEQLSAGRTPSVKRKSLLSSIGIQPETEAPKSATRTSNIKPKVPSTTRKTKSPTTTVNKTLDKTSDKTSDKTPVTRSTTRKTPPSAIKIERGTLNSTVASPTTPKRRSVVPTASPNRESRRSSIISQSSAKRLSTPIGLAELTIEEKTTEKEESVSQRIKALENIKLDNEEKIIALEKQVEQLKNNIEYNLVTSKEVEKTKSNEIQEIEEKLKSEHEQEIKRLLKKLENDLEIKHQERLNDLQQDQDKKLQSELSTLKSECEHMMNDLSFKNKEIFSQMESLKIKNEKLEIQLEIKEKESQEKEERDKGEIKKLNEEIIFLNEKAVLFEKSQTGIYLRKTENELNKAMATLEENKKDAQHHLERIERRHRDEIRQLQSGTDDTAMAWLEKTKTTQQEVEVLHDKLRQKELIYSQGLETLKDQYENEIEELRDICDEKDADIEERSAQIECLLDRVETLQSSLEAATDRLEHTAKSTPSSSSDREDINKLKASVGHEACVKRYEAKQKEIFELKARLAEAKETHEKQLNRLGKEKAHAIQELQRTIIQLEQEKPMTPPPSINDENIAHIVEQHKKEIKMIYNQYQLAVDSKTREIEDYTYKVKALVASRQKETELLEMERKDEANVFEREIEGYEIKVKELEKQIKKYRERSIHWKALNDNTNILLENSKKGCLAHDEENMQLLRLVNQLQSELHKA